MKTIFTSLALLVSVVTIAQDIDTIRVGHRFQHYDQLEKGTFNQLIFTEVQGKKRFPVLKTITVEEVERDGKTYLSVRHDWLSANPETNGSFSYLCEPGTLRPVSHVRRTQQKGVEGYIFDGKSVQTLDTLVDNDLTDFKVDLEVPTYNWEIDIETYSLLPMREGYRAVMNFYHPGASTPPGYYLLEVEGSEQVTLPDGSSLDCWVVFTDYGGTQPTRFWYTKKGQNFVKMEGMYNQVAIYKLRVY